MNKSMTKPTKIALKKFLSEFSKLILICFFIFQTHPLSAKTTKNQKTTVAKPTSKEASISPSKESFTDGKALEIVKIIDDKQRNSGDYKATAFLKEVEKNKEPKLLQSTIYRRDSTQKFMMLFTKPKEEAGKAYLKIDKNLWNFDPGTGKWERRTEREKIGGTNSRRSDYDESKLAEEFTSKAEGFDKLGSFDTYVIKLTAKLESDVAYPIIKIWIDKAENNLLKREEFSLSGKLMRSTFYPKWKKVYSESKKGDVYVPEEIRVFDELEKGNSTIIALKDVELKPLEDNIFTKAWIETKSR